ncbi:hypothetical protein PybrP1_002738 [[Pythium] brassicae (nom. inval.)]|nr:hypothetical protein PybrP1_002738 [[Pythium] brassicae (nom. inval.)]
MSSSAASWTLWVVGGVALQVLVGVARAPPAPTKQHSNRQRQQNVQRFPQRSALHLQRKAQHLLTGLFFYAATSDLAIDVAGPVLSIAALAFLALHHARGAVPRVDALYIACFRGILRQEEAARRVLPGAFYFVAGVALAAALFPLGVARLALLHLTVGDPAASLCGTLFARGATATRSAPRTPAAVKRVRGWGENKSWAGFVGAFVATSLVSALAMRFGDLGGRGGGAVEPRGAALAGKALYSGLVAATAESIDLGWDDNLTLPLLSGIFLQLGAAAFGFEL